MNCLITKVANRNASALARWSWFRTGKNGWPLYQSVKKIRSGERSKGFRRRPKCLCTNRLSKRGFYQAEPEVLCGCELGLSRNSSTRKDRRCAAAITEEDALIASRLWYDRKTGPASCVFLAKGDFQRQVDSSGIRRVQIAVEAVEKSGRQN